MKIQKPLIDIKDQLISFISEGFDILSFALNFSQDPHSEYMLNQWTNKVANYLTNVFPTKKEQGQFLYTPGLGIIYPNMHPTVQKVVNATDQRRKILENILDTLEKYYQFEPESLSIDIQHIDSFEKVRGVNHRDIEEYLQNGFFDRDEKEIKREFAEIIGESFVPKDWPGETEDLYTSRIRLNAQRVPTSIIFNGPGKVRAAQTRLSDLGARGDQLVKMIRVSPSKLYILQSVKSITHEVIETFEALIKDQRSKGNHCYYCVIDGQDTATILYAYGYLQENASPTP
jgi:hypothetical protein